MSDAFSRAAAQATQAIAAENQAVRDQSSDLTDSEDGQSSLFGGEKLPGLFHKFVMPGESRTGIIAKAPVDRQSRNIEGDPKFWDPDTKKVVTHDTGRPMKDTVIVLQTEYRFTPQEIADRNIDPLDVEDDKGVRGIFASGEMKAAIVKAVRAARVRSETEMVGMRLTVTRGKKVPIEGNKTKWTDITAVLERV